MSWKQHALAVVACGQRLPPFNVACRSLTQYDIAGQQQDTFWTLNVCVNAAGGQMEEEVDTGPVPAPPTSARCCAAFEENVSQTVA